MAAMPMNDDLRLILERIEQYFTRCYQTRYWLQVVNDQYDKTYNFFINIQPKGQRVRSIPLHTIEQYNLSYLEKIINEIQKNIHLSFMYDGFTGQKWSIKQELIQKRKHYDE